jgi:hypothetical protein
MEMKQNAVICTNVERVFRRLWLPSPVTSPFINAIGFNSSPIKTYSVFLRNNHGLSGDLIRLHRGEGLLDRRPNKRLLVPQSDFSTKNRWTHFVPNGVIPTFHSLFPYQEKPPANHQSWSEAFSLMIRDMTKAQQHGECVLHGGKNNNLVGM